MIYLQPICKTLFSSFTCLRFCLCSSFQCTHEYYFAADLFCGFERRGVMKWEESIRPCHVPTSQCALERMRQREWAETAWINETLISLLAWCPLVWNARCACQAGPFFCCCCCFLSCPHIASKVLWISEQFIRMFFFFCFNTDLCIYWFICNKPWSAITSFIRPFFSPS